MDIKIRYVTIVFYLYLLTILLLAVPSVALTTNSITAKRDLPAPMGVKATPPEEKVEPKTFTNTIGQRFVWIESGSFVMGGSLSDNNMDEEATQRRVTLTQGFYVQATEVTQGQWKALMGTSPWSGKEYVREGDSYAATYVSWDDAQEFIKKLNQKEGTEKYRLPTEAQWEYACRAGSITTYSFGESPDRLEEYGWYSENTWNKGKKYAQKVGQKQSNNWGLFDMHGNVWEWCSGWYEDYRSIDVTDPEGPAHGSVRVYRGGSWNNSAKFCRSSDLVRSKPDFRYYSLGLRLIRTK